MNSIFPGERALPDRGRLNQAVRDALRHLSTQLSLLTHRVGGRLELRGTDLECLDLIDTCGPIGPSELARRTGLHPATMTGIIDRLERGGWITRERDPHDRRAVVVQVVRSRGQELLRMFAGMNAALTEICADYTDAELNVIARFLNQTADAGRAAAEELPTSPLPDPLVYSRPLGAPAASPAARQIPDIRAGVPHAPGAARPHRAASMPRQPRASCPACRVTVTRSAPRSMPLARRRPKLSNSRRVPEFACDRLPSGSGLDQGLPRWTAPRRSRSDLSSAGDLGEGA